MWILIFKWWSFIHPRQYLSGGKVALVIIYILQAVGKKAKRNNVLLFNFCKRKGLVIKRSHSADERIMLGNAPVDNASLMRTRKIKLCTCCCVTTLLLIQEPHMEKEGCSASEALFLKICTYKSHPPQKKREENRKKERKNNNKIK